MAKPWERDFWSKGEGLDIADILSVGGLSETAGDIRMQVAEPFTKTLEKRDIRNAAKKQESFGREGLDFQKMQHEQGRADLAPWLEVGGGALSELQAGMKSGRFDPSGYQFQEDPGYQFRLQQGEQAINRASAAGGRYGTPRSMQELMGFNQGLASQEYDTGYRRHAGQLSDMYNRLAGLAGTGQTAATQSAQMGNQFGNQYAQGLQGIGNTQAAGIMGQANARNQGMQNLLNLGGQLGGAWLGGGGGNPFASSGNLLQQAPQQSPYAMGGGFA